MPFVFGEKSVVVLVAAGMVPSSDLSILVGRLWKVPQTEASSRSMSWQIICQKCLTNWHLWIVCEATTNLRHCQVKKDWQCTLLYWPAIATFWQVTTTPIASNYQCRPDPAWTLSPSIDLTFEQSVLYCDHNACSRAEWNIVGCVVRKPIWARGSNMGIRPWMYGYWPLVWWPVLSTHSTVSILSLSFPSSLSSTQYLILTQPSMYHIICPPGLLLPSPTVYIYMCPPQMAK